MISQPLPIRLELRENGHLATSRPHGIDRAKITRYA